MVNTKYTKLDDNAETTSSFILANNENGSRTVFAYKKETVILFSKNNRFYPKPSPA